MIPFYFIQFDKLPGVVLSGFETNLCVSPLAWRYKILLASTISIRTSCRTTPASCPQICSPHHPGILGVAKRVLRQLFQREVAFPLVELGTDVGLGPMKSTQIAIPIDHIALSATTQRPPVARGSLPFAPQKEVLIRLDQRQVECATLQQGPNSGIPACPARPNLWCNPVPIWAVNWCIGAVWLDTWRPALYPSWQTRGNVNAGQAESLPGRGDSEAMA